MFPWLSLKDCAFESVLVMEYADQIEVWYTKSVEIEAGVFKLQQILAGF